MSPKKQSSSYSYFKTLIKSATAFVLVTAGQAAAEQGFNFEMFTTSFVTGLLYAGFDWWKHYLNMWPVNGKH